MRYKEGRYGGDNLVPTRHNRPNLTPQQIFDVQTGLNESVRQEDTYEQLTGNQDNFSLFAGLLVHRFTTDASRTITGFASVGVGLKIIANVGAQNLVLANDSGSSVAENRILTTAGANITITPNRFALIYYDFTAFRVRAALF